MTDKPSSYSIDLKKLTKPQQAIVFPLIAPGVTLMLIGALFCVMMMIPGILVAVRFSRKNKKTEVGDDGRKIERVD